MDEIPPPPKVPDLGNLYHLDNARHPSDWQVEAEIAELNRRAEKMEKLHAIVSIVAIGMMAAALLFTFAAAVSP